MRVREAFPESTGMLVVRDTVPSGPADEKLQSGDIVVDVNGDGRADIIGANQAGVSIAYGQADGSFSTAEVITPATTRQGGGWEILMMSFQCELSFCRPRSLDSRVRPNPPRVFDQFSNNSAAAHLDH